MNAWLPLSVVIPGAAAAALLLLRADAIAPARAIAVASTVVLLIMHVVFVTVAGDGPYVHAVGDWSAPFGIVLVLDRLSALMLLLTSVLAALALAHSLAGWDRRGGRPAAFHALFQLQLMGLNGAFLTGDLFNLFVFFEVLLIASIGLLVHGRGPERARQGLRYAVLNLVGSSMLLAGVALLYGVSGTLNMADLAGELPALVGTRASLAHAAGALLLVGFGIKAGAFPLYFWLPGSYPAASAPVAALFAIMTKMGIYALIRVFVLIYGGALPAVLESLVWVGLATVLAGTAGVLASRDLGAFTAYLTIVSVGLMLVGVGLFTPEGTSAALFYLVQSALLLAGLFLLREVVAGERAQAADCFTRGPRLARAAILPALFWLFAAAAVGLPPLTGFFGKLMLLRSAEDSVVQFVIWSVVLVSSLLLTLSAANAGSAMFWDRTPRSEPVDSSRAATPIAPVVIAAALQFVLVLGAEPLRAYTAATALELHAADGYRAAVLGSRAHSKADAALMGTEISP